VLEEAGALRAMGALTAKLLPEAVQLGGIYTPPQLRGQGCARRLVAGMIRQSGAERAVLFTKDAAARRAYLAVGFEVCGTFGLALLG
jgi:predicted GNAT family acetyltransferase